MRLLFLNLLMEAESLGGAEISLLLFLENLDHNRFKSILATNLAGTLSRYAVDAGCRIHLFKVEKEALTIYRDTFSFNPFVILNKYLKLQTAIKELADFVKKENIDLIYTNNIRSHVLGALVAKKTRTPLIWHFRDILYGKMRFLFNFLAKRQAPKIIAVSEAVASNFSTAVKPVVIYNGIEPDSFATETTHDIRGELGLKKDSPLVVLIGRLTRLKRPQDLIKAAALSKKKYPAARFLLVGDMAFERDKNLKSELTALRDELNLSHEVIFTGLRTDIFHWLAQVDVLTLLSEHEAFPRVILEAMAARVPVIATRVGGIPEIVVDNQTGILIDVGDVASLAEKINELLSDPSKAKAMGEAGLKRVVKKFSLKEQVRRVEEELVRSGGKNE